MPAGHPASDCKPAPPATLRAMLGPTELDQLAHAAEALRPDWKWYTVRKILQDSHSHRSYRETARTLAWLAADPATKLGHVRDSPWWDTELRTERDRETIWHETRCGKPGHRSYLARNCGACRADELVGNG